MDESLLVRIQATARSFLARERLKKVNKEFLNVVESCGDDTDENPSSHPNDNSSNVDSMSLESQEQAAVVLLSEMGVDDLHFLRDNISLELLWLKQAVLSREAFLSYKRKISI
ncbi:hypothetical protein SprV_0100487700 [Sparganum proliferum]